MVQYLVQHCFFVGERYSIAAIPLYAYTHVAHKGGFDLSRFIQSRCWTYCLLCFNLKETITLKAGT